MFSCVAFVRARCQLQQGIGPNFSYLCCYDASTIVLLMCIFCLGETQQR